jgi:4-amino-4-deoxy-L-arabinose transferase-like glycosyltransferase
VIRRSSDKTAVILTVVALLLAGGAQAIVRTHLPTGAVGLFVAMLLIAFARTPEQPPGREEPYGENDWPTAPFWCLVAAGVLCCAASGIAVFWRAGPLTSHGLWFLGLLLLIGGSLALYRRDDRRRRRDLRTALVLLALLVLSALLFGWHLTTMPPEVHGDDAEVGLDAIRLLQERPLDLFRSGWFGLPRFHAAPTALGLKIFGINLLGLRATSAVLGAATALLLFTLARRLWGFEVAVLASLVLVSQRFFIHLSRTGYHYIDTPFLSVLALWLFVRVWQERKLGSAVWCGIVLGLGVQTYFASRLVPVLLALTFLLWILGDRSKRAWSQVACFGLIALVAVATAAPAIGYFSHHLDELWGRTTETSVFSAAAREHLSYGYGTDNLIKILLIQGRAALALFHVVGDNSIQYGYAKPLLEPAGGVLLVLGVGLAIGSAHWRRSQLLLLWIVFPFVAGAVFTIDTPFFPRISGLIPFVALAVAVGLHHLLAMIRSAMPESAGHRLAATMGVIVVATVFLNNVQSYFGDYAPRHRHSPAVEISHWIVDNAAGKTTYMVGGAPHFYIRHGAITFMTWGYDTRDIIDLDQYLARNSLDPASSVFVVMPAGHGLIPKLIAAVGPLSIDEHRNVFGQTAFYTAMPQAGQNRQSSPAESLPRKPHDWRFDSWLRLGRNLLVGLITVTGLVAAVLLLRQTAWPFGAGVRRRWRLRRASLIAGQGGRFAMQAEASPEPPQWVTLVGFIVIIVIATVLRTHHLDELPAGFYCDEAGLGYNATSILRTGYDETGTFLPLYVWSFGVSYKNPVFIYSSMLPLAVLGPTELAVRLTAAAYGIATVIALFFLGRAMGGSWVGLPAALLLAVCPWHLHFSRIGFELITEPFFFVVGLIFLVYFFRGRRSLTAAAFFFALTVYTYVPAKLFVPLFLAGVLFVYAPTLRRRWRETAAALGVFVITLLPVGIFDWTHRHQAGDYFQRTTILESDAPPLEIGRTLLTNYVTFFSPAFLLYEGGDRILRHGVKDHGELYPLFGPLLLVGLAVLVTRRDPSMGLPLLWLAAYPVAPALMNEIPSASRGFIGAAAFCLVAGVGAAGLLWLPRRLLRRHSLQVAVQAAIATAGMAVLAWQVAQYWTLYSVEYPKYSAKYYTGFQFGQRQVADYFIQHYDDYDELILTQRRSNQADVFLRFYDGLAQPARRGIMPPFEHREKMRVGWPDELQQYRDGRRLLFAARTDEVALFEDPDVKERVIAPDGSAAFVIVEARAIKNFVRAWQVIGPFEPNRQLTPPDFDPTAPPRRDPGQRRWQRYDLPIAGVGLNDFFGVDLDRACAWAVNFAHAESARAVRVWAGFDDEGEVWINGERLPLGYSERADEWLADSEVAEAQLLQGRNTVAVRSCEEIGDWRFYFRMVAPDGTALPGVRWEYGSGASAVDEEES